MRTFMIGWLSVLGCTSALASPATSKTANGRGMAAMAKKNWAAAETEFKTAVAEDPSSVKAHYNLASAASRAHDLETAIWEIAWVGDRAAWDDEAKAAAKKAPTDDDLTWALQKSGENGTVWVGEEVETNATDLSQPSPALAGEALPEPERGKMAGQLTASRGAHDSKCDAKDAKQGKVLEAILELKDEPKVTAVASLKDGVAIVDAAGAVVARSTPLGCTGPGESQDQLATLTWVVIPRGLGVDTPHHAPSPLAALQILAVSYTNGGRREWQTNVAVFARRDKVFAKVFERKLSSSDATGAGHLWQSPLGNLVYQGPGETKKQPFRWDPTSFAFVPLP